MDIRFQESDGFLFYGGDGRVHLNLKQRFVGISWARIQAKDMDLVTDHIQLKILD